VGSGSEASENIFKIGGVQENMSQSHAKQRIETPALLAGVSI
jgi:hypothetical protein